mmetsp:Transcript_3955/g.8818  ORF Transcript_3955/g.8818 Transcript_3955/m.8818 type:complete len:294 (+) Transcript_3955:16-897(+)
MARPLPGDGAPPREIRQSAVRQDVELDGLEEELKMDLIRMNTRVVEKLNEKVRKQIAEVEQRWPGQTIEDVRPAEEKVQEPQAQPVPVEPEMSGKTRSDAALNWLQQSNERFVRDGRAARRDGDLLRALAAHGQRPVAAVIACSDSRCCPEIVFDASLGDLFVVRCYGALVNDDAIGSVEYAVCHLGVSLVVVMSHTLSGAMAVAVQGEVAVPLPQGEEKLAGLLSNFAPAAIRARKLGLAPELELEVASEEAVKDGITRLYGSPSIREACEMGEAKLVGAIQDVVSGAVRWI